MPALSRIAATAALTAALIGWGARGGAGDYAAFTAHPFPQAEIAAEMLFVTEPAGWQSGDRIAVVLVGAADRDHQRAHLIADLLDQKVAVAELLFAGDLDDPPRIARDAHRALFALRQVMAPGEAFLVGVAWDAGGRAALLAREASDHEGFMVHAALRAECPPGVARPARVVASLTVHVAARAPEADALDCVTVVHAAGR